MSVDFDRRADILLQHPRVVVDFGAVHSWPATKAKLGFAQNLKSLTRGLEGTLSYLQALGACTFSGACEFDQWYKWGAAEPNPLISATYDGSGRAVAMTTAPTTTATGWVTMLNDASIACGIQLIGAVPEYQIAQTYEPRRHPPPTDTAAHGAKVAAWIASGNWPAPVLWSLWNEPMRTMYDCKEGKGLSDETIAETTAAYYVRRSSLKEQAVTKLGDIYLGTFSTASTNIGKWSTAAVGSLVAGDSRDSNGRALPDGRTARGAWWDYYDANIATVSAVSKAALASANDFANRALIRENVTEFNGRDVPIWYTQGGPSTLKISTDDDGGDDVEPAADTRMGPACEMLTMLMVDAERPEVAIRCLSYWLGGVDGFLSWDGTAYTMRHRYSAAEMWSRVPARRVPISASVVQEPDADINLFARQGLAGVAGIDPGGQTAAVLLWNETDSDTAVELIATDLPGPLASASPTIYLLGEASAAPSSGVWPGGRVDLPKRSVHLVVWSVGTSPETRRNPLADGVRTPKHLRTRYTYRRPRNCCVYTDQVRGVAWVCPSTDYNGNMDGGAAWAGVPDSIWLTLWAHNVDNPSATLTILCDYGAGPVQLWTSTVGSITGGQVVQIDLAASAPGGWSAGAREADIVIRHHGAATHRIECWVSGTLAKANAIKGL